MQMCLVLAVGSAQHGTVSGCRRIVPKRQHRGMTWPLKRLKQNRGVEAVYIFHVFLHVSGCGLAAPSLDDLEQ